MITASHNKFLYYIVANLLMNMYKIVKAIHKVSIQQGHINHVASSTTVAWICGVWTNDTTAGLGLIHKISDHM